MCNNGNSCFYLEALDRHLNSDTCTDNNCCGGYLNPDLAREHCKQYHSKNGSGAALPLVTPPTTAQPTSGAPAANTNNVNSNPNSTASTPTRDSSGNSRKAPAEVPSSPQWQSTSGGNTPGNRSGNNTPHSNNGNKKRTNRRTNNVGQEQYQQTPAQGYQQYSNQGGYVYPAQGYQQYSAPDTYNTPQQTPTSFPPDYANYLHLKKAEPTIQMTDAQLHAGCTFSRSIAKVISHNNAGEVFNGLQCGEPREQRYVAIDAKGNSLYTKFCNLHFNADGANKLAAVIAVDKSAAIKLLPPSREKYNLQEHSNDSNGWVMQPKKGNKYQ